MTIAMVLLAIWLAMAAIVALFYLRAPWGWEDEERGWVAGTQEELH